MSGVRIETKNHFAIITGSARGFGKQFAVRLLEAGAKVCISDIDEDQGRLTLKEFEEKYGKSRATFCP